MSLTHEAVQAWLDAYLHAWETYDAADVEALFTEDAEYRYHPSTNPSRAADYHPYAVDGDRAVAVGTSTYFTDATGGKVDRIYYNSWLLEFAPDGRCRSFIEYYMTPPKG